MSPELKGEHGGDQSPKRASDGQEQEKAAHNAVCLLIPLGFALCILDSGYQQKTCLSIYILEYCFLFRQTRLRRNLTAWLG